jgi:hypothetical protein
MAEHAKYSPSRLERILKCPGSVQLIDALIRNAAVVQEKEPSSYAAKGTELHDHTCKAIRSGDYNLRHLDPADKGLVRDCLDYKDMLIKSKGAGATVGVATEIQVSLKGWGLPEVWGTTDLLVVSPEEADVVDWKFGSGVMVHAIENPQLLAYAAGALGWPNHYKQVTMHVFQPAIDHISTWTISTQELFEWVHGTLAVGISKCLGENPPIIPGVDQCRWCEAVNHCDVRFAHVQHVAEEIFLAQRLLPTKITPEAIKELIDKAPLVEQAIKDLKLFVTNEILRGREFPGFKLVAGRANRNWKDEAKALEWLSAHDEIADDLFISKFVSPAQAEKLASQFKKSSEFQQLWEKKEGKPTLVPEKDPRPALQTDTGPIDVFSQYAEVPDKLE